MRDMKPEEIEEVLKRCEWGTLCTVDEEDKPYAIEYCFDYHDGAIWGVINPKGTSAKNLAQNSNVLFKVIDYKKVDYWWAISCFGRAEFLRTFDDVEKGFKLIEKKLRLEEGRFDKYIEKFRNKPENSPTLRITIEKKTGRCEKAPEY